MRLAEIERHVSSMQELQRIVGAMRAIASMRVQEAVHALASVREYGDALEQGVREALAIAAEERVAAGDPPRPHGGRRVLVVFMSEHGFVGGFNERLIEAVSARIEPGDALMVVGSRGAALVAERRLAVISISIRAMATRLASVPEAVRRLQESLYPGIAAAQIVHAGVIFCRYRRTGSVDVAIRQLFPLEMPASRERTREVPLHNLAAAELLERMTAEYILSQLTEAAIESLAAEKSARFAAMEAAHDNVGKRLQALRLDASRARQEEVTTELIDLITGEQAVSDDQPGVS
jgi:F-type H+-transporting ATPase subunit gamma